MKEKKKVSDKTSFRKKAAQDLEIIKVLKKDKENLERLAIDKTHKLETTQQKLKQTKRLADIGTLAATVAHELRNPLGVIHTATYNIRRKRQNLLIDKHLDNIEKKVLESAQIINNLLFYSRIKMPHYEKVEIDTLINESLLFVQKRFHKTQATVNKRLDYVKTKIIQADHFQLNEVFTNILNNAYQSFLRKKGEIEISAVTNDKECSISFKDNGQGIRKENLEKVFDPFFTRKSKGTGLGLTICKELINLHGGNIYIESKKGEGTTVTVTLPLNRKR